MGEFYYKLIVESKSHLRVITNSPTLSKVHMGKKRTSAHLQVGIWKWILNHTLHWHGERRSHPEPISSISFNTSIAKSNLIALFILFLNSLVGDGKGPSPGKMCHCNCYRSLVTNPLWEAKLMPSGIVICEIDDVWTLMPSILSPLTTLLELWTSRGEKPLQYLKKSAVGPFKSRVWGSHLYCVTSKVNLLEGFLWSGHV